jgi:hypothetical protein
LSGRALAEGLSAVCLIAFVAWGVVRHQHAYQTGRRASAALTVATEVPVGEVVPPLLGRDNAGGLTSGPAGATLLLVYSETCDVCLLNWPQWQMLRQSAAAANVPVTLVTLSAIDTTSYRERYQFTGLRTPDPTTLISYRLRYAPQTILVGHSSEVKGVWTGALTDTQRRAVEHGLASVGSPPPTH